MIENWKDVQIVPEFCDQGVDCYRLEGGHFLNEYYIVSEAETRKLMNHPEVGYEVYASLVTATSQMMYYLKEKKKITSANILSILRGALNYPLEESCYKEHIRVHDISFMSSERVFENGEISHPFTDVSGWAEPYIAWLYANSLTRGVGENTFGSTRSCSAQNYAVFLLRALGYADGEDFTYADALAFAADCGV